MWIHDALWLIGGIVVGAILYQFLKEAIRAFRQGRRLAYVYARSRGDRRPPLRWTFKLAAHDFCSFYSTIEISVWTVPHNPGKPIRRSRHWFR